MRAAVQERVKIAQRELAKGHLVFIRLSSSGREHRITAITWTQHNIDVTLDKDNEHWMCFEPDELVGVRVLEYK